MSKKKYLISTVTIVAAAFGIFLFRNGGKTIYVKNNTPYIAAINTSPRIYQAEDKIGDLSNNVIPDIKVPENLTENFAGVLAKAIIDNNNQPKDGQTPTDSGLNMPDPNKIASDFIASGIKTANDNILNIKQPEITTSADNSKEATESYLTEVQKILKDNLNGDSLLSILNEINKNNGVGIEKLLPVISAHEAAASQIEKIPVPSGLKSLITEEIRMLRITANVLRAITNVETDPIATIVAAKQFSTVIDSWKELQQKFDIFIKQINQTQ